MMYVKAGVRVLEPIGPIWRAAFEEAWAASSSIFGGTGPGVADLVAESLAIRPDAVALAKRLHVTGYWAVLREMSAPEGIADLLRQIDLSAQSV